MNRSKTKKSVAIYARVSTDKQKTQMQIRELRAYVKRSKWKIFKEYIDKGYTGADTRRPAFTRLMADAAKKKFDVLLVWKLDRLSCSMRDLVNTMKESEPVWTAPGAGASALAVLRTPKQKRTKREPCAKKASPSAKSPAL